MFNIRPDEVFDILARQSYIGYGVYECPFMICLGPYGFRRVVLTSARDMTYVLTSARISVSDSNHRVAFIYGETMRRMCGSTVCHFVLHNVSIWSLPNSKAEA